MSVSEKMCPEGFSWLILLIQTVLMSTSDQSQLISIESSQGINIYTVDLGSQKPDNLIYQNLGTMSTPFPPVKGDANNGEQEANYTDNLGYKLYYS